MPVAKRERTGAVIGASLSARSSAEVDRAAKVAHRVGTRQPLAVVALAMQSLFGRDLTALMAGVQNSRTVAQWAREETEAHPANEDRLRNAYLVATLLREGGESERTIRSWFTGMNPDLDDR